MIQTGILNVEPLLDPLVYRDHVKSVPHWRREKAERLAKPADQALSIGVWLLYEMLRKEYDVSDQAAYNLSHSGKYALCSLDTADVPDTRVGCDIEKPGRNHVRIAERFFTAEECNYIRSAVCDEERKRRFYRLWVLKESYVKAVRRGMGLGLHNFQFGFTAEDQPYLSENGTGITEQFYFKEYAYVPAAGMIAVCSNKADFGDGLYIAGV